MQCREFLIFLMTGSGKGCFSYEVKVWDSVSEKRAVSAGLTYLMVMLLLKV